MQEISLNIRGDLGKVSALRLLTPPSFGPGKWIGRKIIHWTLPLFDKIILSLVGYFEKSLLFSPEHARKELKTLPAKGGFFKRMRSKIDEIEDNDFQDFPEAVEFVQKIKEINSLFSNIERRLTAASYLDAGAENILTLPEELRNDITELSALRFAELMKQNPEDAEEVYEEMDLWLNAELAPLLDKDD